MSRIRAIRSAALAAALLAAPALRAQSAADHIAEGDREHAALHPAAALQHYRAALQADPRSYEAAWKAARDAVDLGELETSTDRKTEDFAEGLRDARLAVQLNPNDAEGHFNVSRALGRRALSVGPRDRVQYGKEVRDEALAALKLNPNHAGALHIMGMWNAEVMRLNGFSRFMAKKFMGGAVFGEASWGQARRYMERAVAADPDRIVHRIDLAKIYEDTDDPAKARAEYEAVLRLPPTEAADAVYKREAQQALGHLHA